MRSCQFCGSEIPDNASFCGVCGRVASSLPQTIQGNGNSSGSGQINPASGSNIPGQHSKGHATRKPYQFTSQPSQSQQQANVPTEAYSPHNQYQQQANAPTANYMPYTAVSSQAQQARYAPPTNVQPNAQGYPYAQPQSPYAGGSTPPTGSKASLPKPRRKGKGCLISAVVVLLVVVILGAVTIPTAQKALAFGSAISTQSPLSTQTSYLGTSDRVNILVMGYGGSGHDGAYLTDSLVVMSLLPQSHHTSLVSVPRDLYIQYPPNSGNYSKINAIYPVASHFNANPVAGGNAVAQKVSLVTGLDIKYWITINFTGFRDFINAIGGVDVNVPDSFTANYPANDDPAINASWKKVHFAKGLQHMNGETAIEYARARYVTDNLAEGTDFARSARQQLIMKAALSKMKDWQTWPSMFSALDALKHTIYTNLSLADLAQFALKMDLNNAHRVGLSNTNVLEGTKSGDGQDIVLPKNGDWNSIKNYINQQLYN